jgi:hypothetical protein
MKKEIRNLLIAIITTLVVAGGIGFFAGTKYQQNKTTSRQFTFNNGAFMGRGTGNTNQRFGGMNAQAIRGQIIAKDDKSITVKMTDGSTKIIILGSSTTIAKAETGSTNDLANDATVTVIGSTNSDGSVTAQSIQIGNAPFGPKETSSPMPQ